MFHALNQLAARIAAATFNGDATGRPLCVWLPPAPATFPTSRAGYTIEILNNVHRGPAKNQTRDILGNLIEEQRRASLHLLYAAAPDGMPWPPIKEKTTLLLGYEKETAESWRILDFGEIAGRLELSLEKFTP